MQSPSVAATSTAALSSTTTHAKCQVRRVGCRSIRRNQRGKLVGDRGSEEIGEVLGERSRERNITDWREKGSNPLDINFVAHSVTTLRVLYKNISNYPIKANRHLLITRHSFGASIISFPDNLALLRLKLVLKLGNPETACQ